MEIKMTDNEIIKALKNEIKRANYIESYYIDCVDIGVFQNALDLINRQNAEIERLSIESETLVIQLKVAYEQIHKLNMAKSEAIKEFIDELKNRVVNKYEYTDIRVFKEIDNLVKEMTEVETNQRKEDEKNM